MIRLSYQLVPFCTKVDQSGQSGFKSMNQSLLREPKPRATSEISNDLDERLQAYCRDRDLGRAYAVRRALEQFLADEGYPPKLPFLEESKS